MHPLFRNKFQCRGLLSSFLAIATTGFSVWYFNFSLCIEAEIESPRG
jgi:hypothetical protein